MNKIIDIRNRHNAASQIESGMRFICNHDQSIGSANIGWTGGVLENDIPFEAELWKDEEDMHLSVLLPDLHIGRKSTLDSVVKGEKTNSVIGFQWDSDYVDWSVLWIGMVNQGQEEDIEIIQKYITLLEENEVVRFTSNLYNGAMWYLTDCQGVDVIRIDISLTMDGKGGAVTNLTVDPFVSDNE